MQTGGELRHRPRLAGGGAIQWVFFGGVSTHQMYSARKALATVPKRLRGCGASSQGLWTGGSVHPSGGYTGAMPSTINMSVKRIRRSKRTEQGKRTRGRAPT